MLRVMISKGYFLARRDIVRKSSSSSRRVSSAIRRLYLSACDKTMLSMHLNKWLEWKCKSAAQSVGFLYRVVEKSFIDWSCLVVSRKVRKMSSMNIFQKKIAQIKASRMVSS